MSDMYKYIKRGKGVIKMAVSIKPTPVFRGEAAEKIKREMENPKDNTKLFKKCEELANIFKEK